MPFPYDGCSRLNKALLPAVLKTCIAADSKIIVLAVGGLLEGARQIPLNKVDHQSNARGEVRYIRGPVGAFCMSYAGNMWNPVRNVQPLTSDDARDHGRQYQTFPTREENLFGLAEMATACCRLSFQLVCR